MKLVVRVQYIGDRARLLLRDDLAAEYTKGLIDDLEYFGFPMPHEQKPIEKSGFMLCVWHVERDSDIHHTIQDAFIKAKSEAPLLVNRSIRYISLNEDGITHTTSLMNKPYKPKSYNRSEMYPPQTYPGSTYSKPYGKAPKYPTSISQARRGVTPLSQRISGLDPLDHYTDYSPKDVEMRSPHDLTPPREGDAPSSVVDVTQQMLQQLSQSSAFQSLLQRNTTISPVKSESSSDLSALLRGPISQSPQPDIPNLQALLEKAGVKSASAQAILSGQASAGPSATATPVPTTPGNASGTPLSFPLGSSSFTLPTSGASVGSSASLSFPRPPSTVSTSRGQAASANEATRELWDVRRQITALQARDRELMEQLQRLGQPVAPMETPASDMRIKGLQEEIAGLRDALRHEQQTRRVAEATLRAERLRRDEIETVIKDTQRECQQPFVVPALLDAFMKIGQMTGETLRDQHPGTGASASATASTSMDI